MFEKSLYDLIRGLRNHRGNEREYIQNSLRECRLEIRGADMDLKATALLKLVYLEMFGHDMSWASFHVLEVMSSSKYLQKRVGYLGAVQSFRPDTEVLMLATNLLKKDINSAVPSVISLPLVTLPHIITSSLALSLLSDLLPRLSHSDPSIRKKTVVALYRLALVYPDTLRPAWPKIKEMLLDDHEDSSVTAAIINVVCELGWRRPQDFLPLAPRLFDLLVDGGNNWMAIKIIKLFATLTPLEPRLVKKLLPPLTSLIRTTPAMSLLYECINGVIQGGILEGADGIRDIEEIANLCVSKLREMIMIEGDPNLRYVALLAFNKIVTSHAYLVSQHEDVIMRCIDDPDVSIRMLALELGAGMVNERNLVAVVERLMRQLQKDDKFHTNLGSARGHTAGIEPSADSDSEDPEVTLRPSRQTAEVNAALPVEYKVSVIRHILKICAKNTYVNVTDFDWYLEMLVQLIGLVPSYAGLSGALHDCQDQSHDDPELEEDIASAIGWELRNVAVRVSAVRKEAVFSANSMITINGSDASFASLGIGGEGVLRFAVWIVGEFASYLYNLENTLDFLLHPRVLSLPPTTVIVYLQSIPKVLIRIIQSKSSCWSKENKVMLSLLLSRVIHFLENLTSDPNLEVQERTVELLELMRVAIQAIESYENSAAEWPLLLTNAIPALFQDSDLNPVAPTAQKKVPLPDGINLDDHFHQNLRGLLQSVDYEYSVELESADFENLYNYRGELKSDVKIAPNQNSDVGTSSYQRIDDDMTDPDLLVKRQTDRLAKYKDDPFYIMGDEFSSGTSSPFHETLKNINGENVDVDSIPIMDLDLGDTELKSKSELQVSGTRKEGQPKTFSIAMDENIEADDLGINQAGMKLGKNPMGTTSQRREKLKKSLLEVDSSSLDRVSINGDLFMLGKLGSQYQEAEDADMAEALREVERLRLEMQRTAERTETSTGIPPEGTMIKKKRKQKKIVNKPKKVNKTGEDNAKIRAAAVQDSNNGNDTLESWSKIAEMSNLNNSLSAKSND